ncbi:hypothetical protein L1285_21265 [Pseudoalteromonas sp. DL2-H2.2]|uniref:hypothetical protein n=1 Tax=Pseudoalteromonas sp. DL2-H2.2 TaxID=2908889 RepID=UPI001F33037F|nr:hypothetical protein [Pseudoalteromonas sp. DL2-H2.2]MCF2910841.1 hypothetical protein [Pseudoalteromonas sp. DL2-H2.2]
MTYLIRWISGIALLTLALLTLLKGHWVNAALFATVGILAFPRYSQTRLDGNAGYGRKLYEKHLVAQSNERSTSSPYLLIGISLVVVIALYQLLSSTAA